MVFIDSLRNTLLLLCLFLNTFCSGSNASQEIILVGSTPGGESIKSILSISTDTKIDFIRWNLKLDNNNNFVLNITYGESQPNTLDFKDTGRKQIINGTYQIKKQENHYFKEVYQLKSNALSENIVLAKINENLFHILTSDSQLMIGNGGWSYSLNRQNSVDAGEILISSPKLVDKSLQLVFDGRTPCHEIATSHPEMKANSGCFKLKWKLTLNKDSITFFPTTCTIRNIVDNQPRDISGKWTIIEGTKTNPEAIIYRIQVDNLANPMLFLVGDENVLFFLDQNYHPFIGNRDFSFTMNKRVQ